jgi:hypothetical protein
LLFYGRLFITALENEKSVKKMEIDIALFGFSWTVPYNPMTIKKRDQKIRNNPFYYSINNTV